MQDPHQTGSQGFPHPVHEHPVDREAEGEDHPDTPGTPTFLRPPTAGRALPEPIIDPRFQLDGLDFDLPSPISPSRPKSPWGRFDPYDTSEVTPGG